MTKTPESTDPCAVASRESGTWIPRKVSAFLFVVPMALLDAIKVL
jgi:hypothetical protein